MIWYPIDFRYLFNWKLTFVVCATRFSTFLDHMYLQDMVTPRYLSIFWFWKYQFFISAYCTTVLKHHNLGFTQVYRQTPLITIILKDVDFPLWIVSAEMAISSACIKIWISLMLLMVGLSCTSLGSFLSSLSTNS